MSSMGNQSNHSSNHQQDAASNIHEPDDSSSSSLYGRTIRRLLQRAQSVPSTRSFTIPSHLNQQLAASPRPPARIQRFSTQRSPDATPRVSLDQLSVLRGASSVNETPSGLESADEFDRLSVNTLRHRRNSFQGSKSNYSMNEFGSLNFNSFDRTSLEFGETSFLGDDNMIELSSLTETNTFDLFTNNQLSSNRQQHQAQLRRSRGALLCRRLFSHSADVLFDPSEIGASSSIGPDEGSAINNSPLTNKHNNRNHLRSRSARPQSCQSSPLSTDMPPNPFDPHPASSHHPNHYHNHNYELDSETSSSSAQHDQSGPNWGWKNLKREFKLSHSENLFHLYQAKLQHSFFVALLILMIIFYSGAVLSHAMSQLLVDRCKSLAATYRGEPKQLDRMTIMMLITNQLTIQKCHISHPIPYQI